MSIERCEQHDLHYDTDTHHEGCPRCLVLAAQSPARVVLTMGDTPRVDAFASGLYAEAGFAAAGSDIPGGGGVERSPEECYGLAVELAAQLERELRALQAEVAGGAHDSASYPPEAASNERVPPLDALQDLAPFNPNPKPVLWVRTKDGKVDWNEDCVGPSKYDVVDDEEEERAGGWKAIPLYAHPALESRAPVVPLPAWLEEGERLIGARGPLVLDQWEQWWMRHGSATLRMALAHYRAGGRPEPNLVAMESAPIPGYGKPESESGGRVLPNGEKP